MSFVPSKVFFTKGVGRHKEYLSSFELALREAKIEKCNLVTVSSIFPPQCERITVEEGLKHLSAGQITFAVMAVTIAVLGFVYCMGVVVITHTMAQRIRANPITAGFLQKIAGVCLIGFGLKLALSK